MKTYTKFTALVSTILLSSALAVPAQAVGPEPKREISVERLTIATPVVTAPSDVDFDSFDMQATTSFHVEPVKVEAPAVKVASAQATPAPVYTPAAPAQTYTTPAPAPAPVPVQTYAAPAPQVQPQAAPAPAGIGGGGLLGSAQAQLGVQQDCTRMVENALASIGRPVGDLGPAQFLSVGTIVGGPAQPGDILVYGNSHVAIAVDSTTAIHGGFNGGTTGVGPIDVGQGSPTIVRV